MNQISENMTYLIDNNCFCVNITNCARYQLEEKNGYQKQCIEILKKIQHDSQKYSTSEGGDDLSNQK